MARGRPAFIAILVALSAMGGFSLWLLVEGRPGEQLPRGVPLRHSPGPLVEGRPETGGLTASPFPHRRTSDQRDAKQDASGPRPGAVGSQSSGENELPPERKERDPVEGLDPAHEGEQQSGYHPDGSLAWEAEGRRFGEEWVRHGAWRKLHPGGAGDELGHYWRGVEDGPWVWWYPDGRTKARGMFERGSREGRWLFFREDGQLWVEGHYQDGLGQGPWTTYDEEGRVASRGSLLDGKYEGRWEIYEDGLLDFDRSGHYEQGELVEDGS